MGSFLLCTADRVVHGKSFVRGRSVCDACGHTLAARDLIPVVSFCISRGKCRFCGAKLSLLYPVSELLGALSYALTVFAFGISLQTLEALIFISLLLAVSFADLEEYIIPDRFLLIGLIVRLGFLLFAFRDELLSSKRALIAELPDDLVNGGRILSMDAMADFIRDTVKQNSFPKGNAAIILPGSAVYIRNATVPAMTVSQLKYNLPFEFKDYLAEEKSKYIFDYAVLETRNDENGSPFELDIFSCATLRTTMDNYRTMLRRAGFKLKLAVPEEYALSSVLKNRFGEEEINNSCFCIASIGYKETDLFFYRGSRFTFKRVIDLGIFDLERKISEWMDADIHMAHSYIDHDEILKDDRCRDVYDTLAVEIMKAVNFFNYNNRDMELSDLYLGGGLTVNYFRDAITRVTSFRSHLADELLPEGVSAVERPWMFLTAYGSML